MEESIRTEDKIIKCYIYGIGMQYNLLTSYLNLYKDKIDILALVTTHSEITRLDGKEVIRPWEMKKEVDYVIVAAKQYKEIFEILENLGFSDKILRSDIFSVPNFVLKKYLRVKKGRPTILANTCMGGCIYNDLGLKILSPTISIRCENYIRFLKNYKYHLSKDIEVTEIKYLTDSVYPGWAFAPEGITGDSVCWRFVHADNGISAAEKWNRRRHRVNYDNIIALMIIMTDEEAYAFDKLPIKRKLGFYYKDLNLKSVLYTPEWKDISLQYKYDYEYTKFIHRFYARNIERVGKVDWIKFLNGEDNFLRY